MNAPVILLAKRPDPQLPAQVRQGLHPQVEYALLAERLGAQVLDHHDVERSRHPMVRAAARLGPNFGLAMLGYLRRRLYGPIYATGEDVGIPLGMLLRARGEKGRLTVVFHNAGTPRRQAILRALGSGIYHRIIVLGSAQRRLLTRDLGVPAEKVTFLHNWLDHRFYAPQEAGEGDYVLSVGMEQRDYGTLQTAARGLPLRFRVVASGWSPGAGFAPAAGLAPQEGFEIGSGYRFDELKALYAGARFVVVPLKPVSYAAGVTAVLEAFAMGKAVVATASPGILDYVCEGVTGRVVPTGDSAAMRRALEEMWRSPERCREMGRRNRAWIEEECNTERYVEHVAQLMRVTQGEPS